jgi:hypothetical protein
MRLVVLLVFVINKFVVYYRGCSWEHGFMTPQPTFVQIPDRGAIWMFCDTPL